MEKSVSTVWYLKKCAWGAAICCASEAALLALLSALMLRGVVVEEMATGATLACAALATFLGCMIATGKGSERAMATLGCTSAAWLVMQFAGFFACGELLPERSLQLAAVMAAGAMASLLLRNGGKKGRNAKSRKRYGRR